MKNLGRTTKHEIGITERSIFEIGHSVAITLPKKFVKSHGIKKGDKVCVSYNSFILLEPKKQKNILKEMQQKKEALQQSVKIPKDMMLG